MNKTDKLNECLACKFGNYSENKFYAARLTGNTFEFNCSHNIAQNQFDSDDTILTTESMKTWTNSCSHFKPSPK